MTDDKKLAVIGNKYRRLGLLSLMAPILARTHMPKVARDLTHKTEPTWKSKGRHQGSMEKARRLRQIERRKAKMKKTRRDL